MADRSPTVAEAIARCIAETDVNHSLRLALARVSRPRKEGGLGDVSLDGLDATMVGACLDGMKPTSARVVRLALRSFVCWAHEVCLLSPEHAKELFAVRPPAVRRRVQSIEPFTLAEIRAIASFLPEELRALPTFATATGLRLGELLALRWDDLELDGNSPLVRVVRTLTTTGEFTPSKNGSVRLVPLCELALDALALHPRQGELVFARRWPDGTESFLKAGRIQDLWLGACAKARVKPRSFYTLRRTFASENIGQGVPLEVVSAWLGMRDRDFIRSLLGHNLLAPTQWRPWPKYRS